MITPRQATTSIIRMKENHSHDYDVQIYGIFSRLFQSPPTIAELSKEEFLAYRAVTQGNHITRGCVR